MQGKRFTYEWLYISMQSLFGCQLEITATLPEEEILVAKKKVDGLNPDDLGDRKSRREDGGLTMTKE